MKKIAFTLIILGMSLISHAKGFDGKFHYSEATDVFVLMDHVSEVRYESFPAYRKIWSRKFKFSSQENEFFRKYLVLRHRYYKPKKFKDLDQDKLLFSHVFVPQFDFIADAFYTSKSVSEAFKKLSKKLKKDEILFLQEFFKHFQPKIGAFIKESTHFTQKLKAINKQMKKFKLHTTIKKIATFLGVPKKQLNFQIYFVWSPGDSGPRISYGHNALLLHYNPISQTDKIDINEIAQKIVKAVIHRMTYNQKQNLSKRFFQDCNPKGIGRENILEKPLMVLAGTILPYKNSIKKKEFNLYQEWDQNPWVNSYVKMIFPALEKSMSNKENISVSFIQNAALSCSELLKVSHYLTQ